ncbi:uncharacterized protein METZ01_LOCUS115125 [marine metagenome]|uniref:Uncharacterized protein n=1 Tax=marine metagenome TaxID=408172 RepID=A0A381XCP8_9ZZZZ
MLMRQVTHLPGALHMYMDMSADHFGLWCANLFV